MPVLKEHIALELARRAKAFLNLEVGFVRGEIPDPEQQLRTQTRKLQQAHKRMEQQALQIERLRRQLSEGNRRAIIPHQNGGRGRDERSIINDFHELYYNSGTVGGTWQNTYWLGVPTWKCPLDLWVYQEIIFEKRPDLILETGTAFGGSALFMACMCDIVGKGRIVTIDIEDKDRPRHDRIEYLSGSSTDEEIVERATRDLPDGGEVMVILDSDHSRNHVLEELRTYNRFIKKDGYLIVEDTNVNGHPVLPGYGPGPMEAVEDFLKENDNFVVDASKEKFYMTYNPKGYLKKV